jgi:nickel-type superoxide dismutase maturation protease
VVRRVVVEGESMRPALRPGDRLLVLRLGRRLRVGDVIALRDPRLPERVLVKRVAEVRADGGLVVLGDNPAASTDSRVFGPVPRHLVLGRCVWRHASEAAQ